MARPLSMDLRWRLFDAVEADESQNAVAGRFDVSSSAVIKLMQRFVPTGSIEPGQMGGRKEHALVPYENRARELVAAHSDMTLEELREALVEEGVQVGRSSVDRFLKACKLTLKKSRSTPRSKTGRT